MFLLRGKCRSNKPLAKQLPEKYAGQLPIERTSLHSENRPRCSVIFPTLFNYYVHDSPYPSKNISIICYADDFNVYDQGTNIKFLSSCLSAYIDSIYTFFNSLDYKIHQQNKNQNTRLPLDHRLKIQGLNLDSIMQHSLYCKTQATKGKKRRLVLKALCATNWGQKRKTFLSTHKDMIEPVVEYAAPVWSHAASTNSIQRIQTVQNAALRTVTDCTKMAKIELLHTEYLILSLIQHMNPLSSDYFASFYLQKHPGSTKIITTTSKTNKPSFKATIRVP